MALPHAPPGAPIDVAPYGAELGKRRTVTLAKSPELELIRLVMAKGHEISTHSAPAVLILHCLEGRVAFEALGKTVELRAGNVLYLPPHEPHAVRALEDSSLLLTLAARTG